MKFYTSALLILICSYDLHSQNIDSLLVTLKNGKTIILYSDKTWKYLKEPNIIQNTNSVLSTKRIFNHPPFGNNLSDKFYLKKEYDKFKDQTSIIINLTLNTKPELTFYSFYLYEGTNKKIPESLVIGFHSYSDEWEYLKNSNLIILTDSYRLDYGDLDHNGKVGNGYVIEHMSKEIPISDFLKIINSNHVDCKLFTTEFSFTYEQLEALREYYSGMQ